MLLRRMKPSRAMCAKYTLDEVEGSHWSGKDKNIDIPKLFPTLQHGALLQDIWIEFWHLFNELGKTDIDTRELQEDIKIG